MNAIVLGTTLEIRREAEQVVVTYDSQSGLACQISERCQEICDLEYLIHFDDLDTSFLTQPCKVGILN